MAGGLSGLRGWETGISVLWHQTRWRCRETTCVRSSFTEAIDQVPAGWRTTGRLRRAIGAAVGDAARSVVEVAGACSVAWPTAHAAFIEHAEALLTAPEPTRVLAASMRPAAASPAGSGTATRSRGGGLTRMTPVSWTGPGPFVRRDRRVGRHSVARDRRVVGHFRGDRCERGARCPLLSGGGDGILDPAQPGGQVRRERLGGGRHQPVSAAAARPEVPSSFSSQLRDQYASIGLGPSGANVTSWR